MARRPVVPRRTAATHRPAAREREVPPAKREVPPAKRRTAAADAPKAEAPPNVVPAAHRFRELVTGRPWRRRRRALVTAGIVTALLLVGALSAAIWLPALQVQQISVSGLGYVEEQAVREKLDPRLGDSVLLLPTDAIGQEVAVVPGVDTATVERRWPDGLHVSVVESEPVAQLTRVDSSAAVLDAAGEELPAAAAEGQSLIPLTVDAASQDPEGAAAAMAQVLAELPESLRPSLQEMSASSPSDVTFVLALEDGGTKTVVWGDARDAELKAQVVQALLPEPGSVIDVSSPVAPVTR